MVSAPAAARTAAGTRIDNIATLRFTIGGQEELVQSNLVSTRILEQLDVTLVAGAVQDDSAASFLLTNGGNGQEAFALSATANGRTLGAATLFIDADRNGRYDPAIDIAIGQGAVTAMLAPGETLALLVLPGDVDPGRQRTIMLQAQAVTGHSPQGTVFAGQGDEGVDALTGATTARATAQVVLPAPRAAVTLLKSQAVRAPDGSAQPMSGATITYSLAVEAQGEGLRAARLSDPIPVGTDYVPGSLQIDGSLLSDAEDSDVGNYDGAAIHVALGDLTPTTTHVVTFQVKIP